MDGDCAARTTISAADSGSRTSAGCLHCAVVDGDGAARSIKSGAASAADARAAFVTVCGHFAAVDGDCACSLPVSAADARIPVAAVCGQPSRVFPDRLGINGKTVALCHIDAAVDGQACVICQNQMNLAADGDAVADGHSAVDYIPAIAPFFRRAINDSHIVGCLFSSARVKIFHAIFGCEGINHPIKVIKQTFKKFCAGDFRFLLVRQGFVGFVCRLQIGVNCVLLIFCHGRQLVRCG